jgi:hypothetical protein
MALGKKDIFTPADEKAQKESSITQSENNEEYKRHTYYLKRELVDKVDRYAYWERLNKSDIVNEALEKFFKRKKIKSFPTN